MPVRRAPAESSPCLCDRYLANMGVRASMSISVLAFGSLYGLISCHTYGELLSPCRSFLESADRLLPPGRFGRRVSFPVRQLCKLLGHSISRNIERLSYVRLTLVSATIARALARFAVARLDAHCCCPHTLINAR